MQCERAEEFFSDYLERTLDRPMTVALEAHLASCVRCREEVESLQTMFVALEEIPVVEPPADGAWQVLAAMRNARAEQIEVERQQQVPWYVELLRTFTPARAAFGAGLATLMVAGSLMLPHVRYERLGFVRDGNGGQPAVTARPAAREAAPALRVSYGPVTTAGQQVNLQIVPARDLPGAQVQVAGAALPMVVKGQGDISSAQGAPLVVYLPASARAELISVKLTSAALSQPYGYRVAVPLADRQVRPVTVSLVDQPLDETLKQVASSLGRPVVVSDGVDGTVSLQVAEQPAMEALRSIAGQVGATVAVEGSVYRLSPAR